MSDLTNMLTQHVQGLVGPANNVQTCKKINKNMYKFTITDKLNAFDTSDATVYINSNESLAEIEHILRSRNLISQPPK